MPKFLSFIIVMMGIITLVGCGKSGKDEESVAKKTGAKVGEAVTEFATGMGKGIDKQMTLNAELSPGLKEKGISMTIAKGDMTKRISVYLIASKPLKAKLIAKAINESGQEIGRSVVDVNFAADDAGYTIFTFHEKMDTQLVKKYFIDIKSILPEEPAGKIKV